MPDAPDPPEPAPRRRRRWKRWALLGLFLAGLVVLDGPGWRWIADRAAMHFLYRRDAVAEVWPGASLTPLSGFLYANGGGACVFVREEDAVARRRFCAAHELGHYLLHWPMVVDAARAQIWAAIS